MSARGGTFALTVATARPAQWTKNLFVLGPLLFAKRVLDPSAGLRSIVACASFCLMSSAIYVLNDLADAEQDRNHPLKRIRPLASGMLSRQAAWLAFGLLAALASVLSISLGSQVAFLAVLYFAAMVAYCVRLKHVLIIDSLVIAIGFVLRVVAGAAAVHVEATHWLVACTFLLALYLAFAKRRQELTVLSGAASSHRHVLSEYSSSYLDQVNNILLGTVVLCYALYTVAPETVTRFGTDRLIYGTVFVLYGMLRYMVLLHTGRGADPSVLVLRDRPLLIAVLCWAMYNCLVIYRREITEIGNRLFSSWRY
ncbi:MAG: decaprenyl-phosphate phosphoribosyltransferase [Acidobacteriia bacterium]|nr:decaprenyl-phosphate phosphoribosyltransferase [Terriglobia bacterium]